MDNVSWLCASPPPSRPSKTKRLLPLSILMSYCRNILVPTACSPYPPQPPPQKKKSWDLSPCRHLLRVDLDFNKRSNNKNLDPATKLQKPGTVPVAPDHIYSRIETPKRAHLSQTNATHIRPWALRAHTYSSPASSCQEHAQSPSQPVCNPADRINVVIADRWLGASAVGTVSSVSSSSPPPSPGPLFPRGVWYGGDYLQSWIIGLATRVWLGSRWTGSGCWERSGSKSVRVGL